MISQGTTDRLVKFGNEYILYFNPITDDEPSRHSAYVRLRNDLDGGIHGFKRFQPLRLKGSVKSASVRTEEVPNFVDGGTRIQSSVEVPFQIETLYIDQKPI